MANVSLWGSDYANVSSIIVPATGGGTATFTEGGGGGVKQYILRPDAELVKTWSYDKKWVADLGETLPSYSTSSNVLSATAALSETASIDYDTYDYILLLRSLSMPIYSTETGAQGRNVCHILVQTWELTRVTGLSFGGVTLTPYESICKTESVREFYFSSKTVLTADGQNYGVNSTMTTINPSVTNGVLTVPSPNLIIRGNTQRFSSSSWSLMTDFRHQWKWELWRARKTNRTTDGWTMQNTIQHCMDCYLSANRTLT